MTGHGSMDLTGFETKAAATLVRLVDSALLGWTPLYTGPGLWTWENPAENQVVVVNALPDRILVPTDLWPPKVGPTLLGGTPGGLFASATLPDCCDICDIREAIRVVSTLVEDLSTAA